MKILHVYNHFYPCIGGIESYIEDICRYLVKKGITSDVLCLNKCANSEKILPRVEKLEKIKIIRLPFLDFKFYKISPLSFELIKKYDILHVHGFGFFCGFSLSN